jgi:HAD superfamily hydrolase (TIGR01509 family)
LNASLRFDAVLFDCDGVLVDGERITNAILRDMLEERGWNLPAAECMELFIGKALKDQRELIERNTGKPLTEEWLAGFRARRNDALLREVKPIANALETATLLHELFNARIACASGADRFKVEMQLEKCGLLHLFRGRVFSGFEVPRSKPAPDVYLAAATALGADPARCAVVEDTATGVTAGVAAGAMVFGYSPAQEGHDSAPALRAAGAVAIVTDLAELPQLLR